MLKISGVFNFMTTTKKSLFVGFVYKASVLRKYSFHISRFSKHLTFDSISAAQQCFEDMNYVQDEYGIKMVLKGRVMKLVIKKKLVQILE